MKGSVDPRTPVLIGAGQVKQRVENPRDGVEPLESVSYTHLRAHETRSNLVCRLLLEKKKEIYELVLLMFLWA